MLNFAITDGILVIYECRHYEMMMYIDKGSTTYTGAIDIVNPALIRVITGCADIR